MDSLYIDMPMDNCGEVTLTWVDTPGSAGCVLPVGAYTRIYTAVDECNNTMTAEQILLLTDEEAPVFDFVPADYTAECDEELTYEAAAQVTIALVRPSRLQWTRRLELALKRGPSSARSLPRTVVTIQGILSKQSPWKTQPLQSCCFHLRKSSSAAMKCCFWNRS